jgi:hypothetical protein
MHIIVVKQTFYLHSMHVCLHACMQIHGDGVYTDRSFKKGDNVIGIRRYACTVLLHL